MKSFVKEQPEIGKEVKLFKVSEYDGKVIWEGKGSLTNWESYENCGFELKIDSNVTPQNSFPTHWDEL
jgi:hypothetical protein